VNGTTGFLLALAAPLFAACSFFFDDSELSGGAIPTTPPSDASVDVATATPVWKTEVLVRNQPTPHFIVLDDVAVYWLNEGPSLDGGGKSSQVMRLAREGSADARMLVSGIDTGVDFASDPSALFWIEGPGGCVAGTGVGAVAKDGTGRSNIASSCYRHRAVRADTSDVYVLSAFGAVARASKVSGSAFTPLSADGVADDLLALSRDYVYVSDTRTRSILRFEKANVSASQRLFAGEQDLPRAIVTDATHVYWVTSPAGRVSRLAHDTPGGAPLVLADKQDAPIAVALDAASVYFANAGDGTIARVPKDTPGIPEVIGRVEAPCGLAADDRAVYVTDCKAGTVSRLFQGR
jgi:hypothetical protein